MNIRPYHISVALCISSIAMLSITEDSWIDYINTLIQPLYGTTCKPFNKLSNYDCLSSTSFVIAMYITCATISAAEKIIVTLSISRRNNLTLYPEEFATTNLKTILRSTVILLTIVAGTIIIFINSANNTIKPVNSWWANVATWGLYSYIAASATIEYLYKTIINIVWSKQ